MVTGKNIHCPPLHWSELFLCGVLGVLRKVIMIREGQGQSAADKPDKWAREIEGNCGELVFAKLLHLPWVPRVMGADKTERQLIKRFDVADLQVRTTHWRNGHLPLLKTDNPDDKFVLVIGESPNFRVVGWIRARDGMKEQYWDEKIDKPAYMVPQDILHGLESLLEPGEELEW